MVTSNVNGQELSWSTLLSRMQAVFQLSDVNTLLECAVVLFCHWHPWTIWVEDIHYWLAVVRRRPGVNWKFWTDDFLGFIKEFYISYRTPLLICRTWLHWYAFSIVFLKNHHIKGKNLTREVLRWWRDFWQKHNNGWFLLGLILIFVVFTSY